MSSAASTTSDAPLSVGVPPGYTALPLANPREALDGARDLLRRYPVAGRRELIDATIDIFEVLLTDLAERGARYCGLGRHKSAEDDSLITSTLIVTVLDFPEGSDPNALLQELGQVATRAGDVGRTEIVTLDSGRPVALREWVRTYPARELDGVEAAGPGVTPVYQLQALVPSFDGSHLADIELSTPYVTEGPQFQSMVLQMVLSASFGDETDGTDGAGRDGHGGG